MQKNRLETAKRSFSNDAIRFIWFLVTPLILLISLEVMHLSYPLAADVFFQSKFFLLKLAITYVFLLCWQGFFYALTQSSFVANFLNIALMFLITYTSEIMGRINGDPLQPCNLLLVSSVGDITSFIEIPFILSALVSTLINTCSLGFHLLIVKRFPVKKRWTQRLGFGVIAIVAFALVNHFLCFDHSFRYKVLPKIDINISAFNPIEDYQANGPILTFFPRIGDLIVPKPANYHRDTILAMRSEYEEKSPPVAPVKANVIIIQNESWWDPSVLPEVSYSVDLLSGVHSLSENTITGTFVSPKYGGGTCLPEFEVVTGIPTYLLPSAAYPYTQYIHEPTPSLISAYQNQNYQTVALHPYKKNFYQRDTAYPLLGFDIFKSADEFTYQDKSGAYIDDMACVKQIIDEFETKTADRIMEFVVTMENHGTYQLPRYESFDFEMDAPTLSEADYMDLKRYSQGVYHADKAFMTLVDYFSNVEEPVILVMYGDHLPLLGTNGSTCMDSGFIEHTDTFVSANYPKLYETPYVVWTNYPMPDFDLQPKVSGNTLGLKIFMGSGNEIPWYMNVLNELSERYPVTVNTAVYDENMENVNQILPEDASFLDQVNLLIYDILHGKQYCLQK